MIFIHIIPGKIIHWVILHVCRPIYVHVHGHTDFYYIHRPINIHVYERRALTFQSGPWPHTKTYVFFKGLVVAWRWLQICLNAWNDYGPNNYSPSMHDQTLHNFLTSLSLGTQKSTTVVYKCVPEPWLQENALRNSHFINVPFTNKQGITMHDLHITF